MARAKKKAPGSAITDTFWSEAWKIPEGVDTPRKTAARWQETTSFLVCETKQFPWWDETLLTKNEFMGILFKVKKELNWDRIAQREEVNPPRIEEQR